MSDSRDIAVNCYGAKYDTGRQNRRRNLVIRVRRDGNGNSKNAAETEHLQDDTRAGKEWSAEELDVRGVDSRYLVIVIGEWVRLREDTEKEKSLRENENTMIDTASDAFVVVRRLKDQKNNLQRICFKENGLCDIRSLGKNQDRVVFYYQDWVTDFQTKQYKKRKSNWRQGLTDFSTSYMKANAEDLADLLQSTRAAAALPKHWTGVTESREHVMSCLWKAAAKFQTTAQMQYLDQVIALGKQALGYNNSPDWKDQDGQRALVRTLVEAPDQLNLEEAAETANACKQLWSSKFIGVDPPKIDATTLARLSEGLYNRALGETIIGEELYRAFVIHFCILQDGKPYSPKQRDLDIQSAYRNAVLCVGEQPETRPPMAVEFGDKDGALVFQIDSQIEYTRYLVKAIQTLMRTEQSEYSGGFTSDPKLHDLPELLRAMADTTDWDDLRDKLNHLVQLNMVQSHAKIGVVLKLLETELAGLEHVRDHIPEYEEGEDNSDGASIGSGGCLGSQN